MFPNLLGFQDSSYILFMVLGVVAAIVTCVLFVRKKGYKKSDFIDITICTCFAVVLGIIFAILFENLYEVIALGANYKWVWKMTFYGGLLGGVIGFLLTYFIMLKTGYTKMNIKEIVVIAPASICFAHGFGRIGCFFAGCCYGKPTDSWIGVLFPGMTQKVIPTQLIEAIFLFILGGVILFLAIKKDFLYNFDIYLIGYGIFRFVIEFFRDDDRGVAFALSPSQVWSIILIVFSIPLFFILRKLFLTKNEHAKE